MIDYIVCIGLLCHDSFLFVFCVCHFVRKRKSESGFLFDLICNEDEHFMHVSKKSDGVLFRDWATCISGNKEFNYLTHNFNHLSNWWRGRGGVTGVYSSFSIGGGQLGLGSRPFQERCTYTYTGLLKKAHTDTRTMCTFHKDRTHRKVPGPSNDLLAVKGQRNPLSHLLTLPINQYKCNVLWTSGSDNLTKMTF